MKNVRVSRSWRPQLPSSLKMRSISSFLFKVGCSGDSLWRREEVKLGWRPRMTKKKMSWSGGRKTRQSWGSNLHLLVAGVHSAFQSVGTLGPARSLMSVLPTLLCPAVIWTREFCHFILCTLNCCHESLGDPLGNRLQTIVSLWEN